MRSSLKNEYSKNLKIKAESQTTMHRSTKSLVIPSYSKASFPKQRNSNIIESCKEASKHIHRSSVHFPISSQNLRLIKVTKTSVNEDKVFWKNLTLPLTARQVLKDYKHHLTPFEEIEILTVEEIYYIGIGAQKVKTGIKNNGFDEDNGDYRVIAGDHLAYRYEIISILGSGSFGTVIKVFDHKLSHHFAIKVIKNRPKLYQAAIEEIEVLRYIESKDPSSSDVVFLLDMFDFRNHACLKFELLGMNLYQYIKLNSFKPFSAKTTKKIAQQILKTLSFLQKIQVIHCDLKPENILFTDTESLNLKVIDFGSATLVKKRIYSYIQSRFYRSPEVILGIDYSEKIDMWSFGCILAELATGRPLFPAEDEADLINCIMEVLGPPPVRLLAKSTRKNLYFDEDLTPRPHQTSRGISRVLNSKPLSLVLKDADSDLADLISRSLKWETFKRITPEEALAHRFFQSPSPKSRHSKSQSQAVFTFRKLFSNS